MTSCSRFPSYYFAYQCVNHREVFEYSRPVGVVHKHRREKQGQCDPEMTGLLERWMQLFATKYRIGCNSDRWQPVPPLHVPLLIALSPFEMRAPPVSSWRSASFPTFFLLSASNGRQHSSTVLRSREVRPASLWLFSRETHPLSQSLFSNIVRKEKPSQDFFEIKNRTRMPGRCFSFPSLHVPSWPPT